MKVAFYKGNMAGWNGFYDRLIRFWTRGPYSHVELIFSDNVSASSSLPDGGVRFKRIDYDLDKWDIFELSDRFDEQAARKWFNDHEFAQYDLMGILHFVLFPILGSKRRWFCSEAVLAALGFTKTERVDPTTMSGMVPALM